MEILLHWIREHGFDLIGVLGLIASLGFTASSFRQDEKSRRIGNLLALTAAHREIWTNLYQRPELIRVLDPKADLVRQPVTDQERIFMTFLILHLNVTWQAMREDLFRTRQAIAQDVRWLYSLPIPRAVWEQSKALQDAEFVRFVEQCRGNI